MRRAALLLLPCIPLLAALYLFVRDYGERTVRFVVYRPTTSHFYVTRPIPAGGKIEGAEDAAGIARVGAVSSGIGLVCPQIDRANPNGYRIFADGVWFDSDGTDRTPKGDLRLGQAGDLPFCADFDGDGRADDGVFRAGEWLVSTRARGDGPTLRFGFGQAGDQPVVVNLAGRGNGTDRHNVVYGVYRAGVWHLDTDGDGNADAAHNFGGDPADVARLIPRWSSETKLPEGYSLLLFRRGTWYLKPDPEGAEILTFGFGQPGDVPWVAYSPRIPR